MAEIHLVREREKFEAWAIKRGLSVHRLSDSYGAPDAYRDDNTYHAWMAWQERAADAYGVSGMAGQCIPPADADGPRAGV